MAAVVVARAAARAVARAVARGVAGAVVIIENEPPRKSSSCWKK